jgi:Ca2+-binding RTX toxin-like protein
VVQGQQIVSQFAGDYVNLAATSNCDTSLYSLPFFNTDGTITGNYTVEANADGSVTVTDTAFAAAADIFAKGDGIDTLWNAENLRFCTANDAVTKNCTTWQDISIPNAITATQTGTVPVVGGPSTPVATLSTTTVGFAARALPAGPSAPLTVTLTNTGGGSLGITSSSITGANAAAFTLQPSPATTCGASLGAGASCTFSVTFDPNAAAVLTASLSIVTSVGTKTVNLTGTGIANTAATGAPLISDTTPTQGHAISASIGSVADVDGVGPITYSWRQSLTPGGAIQPAVVGTGVTFTPATANVRVQVTATFTDGAGTAESRPSAITTVVGEVFNGTAGIDIKVGTAGQDEYHGAGSADNLATGAEDDLVSGDAGDDTISTNGGNDVITFSGTGEGFDAVTGGAGSDAIIPLTDGTTIGLRSISTIEDIDATGKSGIHILGSAANDVLNFTTVTLTNIISIDGGGGNDQITGSGGNDWIIGRAGTDTLNGGPGVDTIDGGAGNDTLRGGVGLDTFVFAAGFGADTIADFDAAPAGGQDKIDLRPLGITAATFAANVTHTAGSNTVITVAGGGTIRLSGVNGPAIDASDFILAP